MPPARATTAPTMITVVALEPESPDDDDDDVCEGTGVPPFAVLPEAELVEKAKRGLVLLEDIVKVGTEKGFVVVAAALRVVEEPLWVEKKPV